MKKIIVCVSFVFFMASSALFSITIKLASPFPEGTEWDISLKRMAAEWADITDNQVRVRIYPGGVVGNEGDMIRKMRFGQLDAAILTAFGLKLIVPESFILSLPGMLQSDSELDYVLENFAPQFNDVFIANDFRMLTWSKSGWVNFYTSGTARTAKQMKNERLGLSDTDEEISASFKSLDFNVVPTNMGELMVSLQSGMVSAFLTPPMLTAVFQWFAIASQMIDFAVAPALGGLVISERTWQRIPDRYHQDLEKVVEGVAQRFYQESERLNKKAMETMIENGLEVYQLSGEERDAWYKVLRDGYVLLVGEDKWISQDLYNQYSRVLGNFRKKENKR